MRAAPALLAGALLALGAPVLAQPTGPAPAVAPPRACFYTGPNFTGARRCGLPGDFDDAVRPPLSGAIESILISGHAAVKVCTGYALHGDCAVLDLSVRRLPYALRDAIVSYRIGPPSRQP